MASKSQVDDLIERTKSCLTCRLTSCIPELPIDLLSSKNLSRPSFSFIHILLKVFVEKLSFATGLYNDAELGTNSVQSFSKQEKIRFLFKALVCVSRLTNERVDLFVSPAKTLSGQDVNATLYFLQCLTRASLVSTEISSQTASEVTQRGELNMIYRQSVKTRNLIIKVQAIFRGRLARLNSVNRCNEKLKKNHSINQQGKVMTTVMKNATLDENNVTTCPESAVSKEVNQLDMHFSNSAQTVNMYASNRTENNPIDQGTVKREEKQSLKNNAYATTKDRQKGHISYRPKEISTAVDDVMTNNENEVTPKRPQKCQIKPKPNLDTIPEKKVVTKLKIVNGIKVRHQIEIPVENKNVQNIRSREDEIDALLSQLKARCEKLKEKESKLEQKVKEAKQKEEHLHVCESRVTRLAANLRKKEDRLQKERMKQALEVDRFRLESVDLLSREKIESKENYIESTFDETNKYEELWKRACKNPTITDLRLKLEAKQNAMKKRHIKMIQLEKELQHRLEEVEEERKQIEKEKEEHYEASKIVGRYKRKPVTTNLAKNKAAKTPRKNKQKEETSAFEEHSRRRAFLENKTVNDVLQKLAKMNNSNLHHNHGKKALVFPKKVQIITNVAASRYNNETNRQVETPSPLLSRKRSDGNLASSNNPVDSTPRSLIRYSSHYSKNERPSNYFS